MACLRYKTYYDRTLPKVRLYSKFRLIFHVLQKLKKDLSIASARLEHVFKISHTPLLKLAQNFSIGFKSGEYGGKNKISHPAFSMISILVLDL